MAQRGSRNTILLDWFNITYRSVLLVSIIGVGLLAAAIGYWYYSSRVAPKTQASAAIARAETKLIKVGKLPVDDQVAQAKANATTALEESRTAFNSDDYDIALQAAMRSENISIRLLDLKTGTKADGAMVRFLRIEGDVKVKKAGEFSWDPADQKMFLRVGDQVKTSSTASAQILYFDGSKTTIQPGSLLEIRDLFEDPETKVRRVREKLTWGAIEASTRRRTSRGPSTRLPPTSLPPSPRRRATTGLPTTRRRRKPPSTSSRGDCRSPPPTARTAWERESGSPRTAPGGSRPRRCCRRCPA